MAVGIYKPGQGYWVRVLTACMMGMLTLAAAGWLWSEGAVIADKLPAAGHRIELSEAVEGVTEQSVVTLLADGELPTDAPVVIGTASLVSVEPGARVVAVNSTNITASGRFVNDATSVRIGAAPDGTGGIEGSVRSVSVVPMVQPLYVQGALAALVLLFGAILTYWYTAAKPQSVEFLIATDGEMKKVNWSTRKDVIGSTWVVVVAGVLIAAMLFVFDFVFQTFFRLIGVLET